MYYFYFLLLCGINVVIEVVCKFSVYFKDIFLQTCVIYILISTKATPSSKYVDLVARTHLYSTCQVLKWNDLAMKAHPG